MTQQAPSVVVSRSGGVGYLTLSRPERLNAVTDTMLETAARTVEEFTEDPEIRVIVITGGGRAFSAGADITPTDATDPSDPGAITGGMLEALAHLIVSIHSSPLPVVAAVNGPAVGVGASVAFACDLPVAKSSAYFSLAFVNLGLVPDGAATLTVPEALGTARAMRLALLGEKLSATDAAQWGLIANVYPDEDFDNRVASLVARLAAGPRGAHAAIKSLIRPQGAEVASTLRAETESQLKLIRTTEFLEGVRAVRERRPPRFP